MKFIQTPVRGMQDFLPSDMVLRTHVLGIIRDTYIRYGFTEIETPVMEHIENLTGKNGGENEKLIFKVEKRGRELDKSLHKVFSLMRIGDEAAERDGHSSGDAGTESAGGDGHSSGDAGTESAGGDGHSSGDAGTESAGGDGLSSENAGMESAGGDGHSSGNAGTESAGGDGLSSENAGTELADSALRYDLTVPLARYYSNHKNELPSPFKALQIGSVFRADRPQKGRFRQFTQCDIDIIGDSSYMAETELIVATCRALGGIFSEVGIQEFTVHINDRRILKAMAESAGFAEEMHDDIFIVLDKMDRIGERGVRDELLSLGNDEEQVIKYMSFFAPHEDIGTSVWPFIRRTCASCVERDVVDNLETVIRLANGLVGDGVVLKFDPALVRGMGYYTGTIFEISIDGFPSSIAGGGRYDRMVGKFLGRDEPACGFSIGFERIVSILKDSGWRAPESRARKAYLIDMKNASQSVVQVLERAEKERKEGKIVIVQPLKKNARFQVENLMKNGWADIVRVYGGFEGQ